MQKIDARSSQVSVDVFLTACGEELELIERSLIAAVQMNGEHKTWLLDDGHDLRLAHLAQKAGAEYLTRENNADFKAGNLNAALERTTGDIVVIFDVDHIPRQDFLEQTISLFADERVGFVQVMLTFSNADESWIARAAVETSLDYYNAASVGANNLQAATLVGSNALIRRSALESIGGYQPGLAEDLNTSITLHAAGWRSIYVQEPLAPGLAPPDLNAWFIQQFKWSRGVFELLLTAYPRHFLQLSLGQKVSYAVRMTYYWIGLVVAIHTVTTITVLFSQQAALLQEMQSYLLYMGPIAGMMFLIRQRSIRCWLHPSQRLGIQWRAVALVYTTWPIYTLAWLMALLRVPLGFRATPKQMVHTQNHLWMAIPLSGSALLIIGAVYNLFWSTNSSFLVVYIFALMQALPPLIVWVTWIYTERLWLSRGTTKATGQSFCAPTNRLQEPHSYQSRTEQ